MYLIPVWTAWAIGPGLLLSFGLQVTLDQASVLPLYHSFGDREGSIVQFEPPAHCFTAYTSQLWIAATFAGSMWSPIRVSIKPRYSTVSMWNLHFLGFAYSPASWSHLSASCTWSQCWSMESE